MDRAGRSLIRDTLDDAGVTLSVSCSFLLGLTPVYRGAGAARIHPRRIEQGPMGRRALAIIVCHDDGELHAMCGPRPWETRPYWRQGGARLLAVYKSMHTVRL